MIDASTEKPLRVASNEVAGPYIRVPLSQLGELTNLLSTHQIRFEVDELAISWNGAPEMTVVNLGRRGDAAAVQRIIDEAR